MRWIGEAVWLITAVLVYAVYSPLFSVGGMAPVLPIIILVRVALTSGPLAGNIVGFASGLLLDIASVEWFGSTMLVNSLIGYILGSIRERIVLDSPLARVFVLLVTATVHTIGVASIRSLMTPGISPEPFALAVGSGIYSAIVGGIWWGATSIARAVVGWRSNWHVGN